MAVMRRCRDLLVMMVLLVLMLPARASAEPGDLETALAEVDAVGGLVTLDDLDTDLEGADRWPSGECLVALSPRHLGPTRVDATLSATASGLSFAGRWRRQGNATSQSAWLGWTHPAVSMGVGGGGLSHGAGLLTAGPGGRSVLSVDGRLVPGRAGWRQSCSLGSRSRLEGAWLEARMGGFQMSGALARDLEARVVRLTRVAFRRGGTEASALVLRRVGCEGMSVATTLDAEPWHLDLDATRWTNLEKGGGKAALIAVRRRIPAVLVEVQAAVSDAPAGAPQALKPACLLSWRSRGWAARMVRRFAGLRLGMALGWSRGRKAGSARGDVQIRRRLECMASGRFNGGERWQARVRRTEYDHEGWIDGAPWLPPARTMGRRLTSLLLRCDREVPLGEVSVAWRQRHEDDGARHLVTLGWRLDTGGLRIRAQLQNAWGQPLDLVSLGVPVGGYYVVQHWGHWQSGVWLGVEGERILRWQAAVVVRRPADVAVPSAVEGRIGVGVCF